MTDEDKERKVKLKSSRWECAVWMSEKKAIPDMGNTYKVQLLCQVRGAQAQAETALVCFEGGAAQALQESGAAPMSNLHLYEGQVLSESKRVHHGILLACDPKRLTP